MYDGQSKIYDTTGILYATTMDSYTRNLNITWQPMQPNNMTYLVIDTYPQLRSSYRFDETGFWTFYWQKLWEKRLTLTPTPALRNALLSYQDSYILVWVFVAVSLLLAIMLAITCSIICRKIKKEKYDEDDEY